MFKVSIIFQTQYKYISNIILSLELSAELEKALTSKSLFMVTPLLDPDSFSFLQYWESLKPKKNTINLEAPFSHDLLSFFEKIPATYQLDNQIITPKFSKKSYSPKLFLNIPDLKIALASNEKYYLLEGFQSFCVSSTGFAPISIPLSNSHLKELFQQGETNISSEESIFLASELQKEDSYFNSYLQAPDIVEIDDITPIFEFSYQNNRCDIELFLEAEVNKKKERFVFDLEKAQILLKQNLPLSFFNNKNTIILVSNKHPLRKKIEEIVQSSFKNFYSLLGEIEKNRISSNDKSNIFEEFLPTIADSVSFIKKQNQSKLTFILPKEKPSVSVSSLSKTPLFGNIDWLSVDFEFDYNTVKLSLNDLKTILEQGFIEKDDNIITLTEDTLKPIEKLLDLSKRKESDQLEIRASFLPWILSLYPNADIPQEWSMLKEFIQNNTLPEISLPENAETVLRDYQKTGVKRLSLMHNFGFGVVLADEMGLGKTLQILTLLDIHCDEGKILIVTPSSLTLNWNAEIEKFYPNRFKTLVVRGSKLARDRQLKNMDDYDIIITSYHTLGSDYSYYEQKHFQFLVIDEAQHIKNKKAKRSQSVKKINARTRIAVSGTPLENNISELWSIFDFIMPEFLGTYKEFQRNFEDPLHQFDREKRREVLHHIHQITMPFIIRRTKATTYKELPPKIEQTIITELTTKQKSLYLDTLSKVRSDFLDIVEKRGFNQSRIDFLSTLTKLRQITLHPALVYPELYNEDSETISAKIIILLELLFEAFDSGHRVLVFSQFVSMLELIKVELNKYDIEFLYIDGKTQNRVELADQFNQGKVPIFLISLKAGGIGLNLTGADTVILFDPWWNPSVENQAIDRAHRIGQENTVNVYRLMTKGTIEEKIFELQRKKEFLFENIMQENPEFEKFSSEELLSLLNIDPEEFSE